MKRNLLKTLAVACVTSVMLMGCGNTGSAEDNSSKGNTITVTDVRGNVEIPADPQRIVDLSGNSDILSADGLFRREALSVPCRDHDTGSFYVSLCDDFPEVQGRADHVCLFQCGICSGDAVLYLSGKKSALWNLFCLDDLYQLLDLRHLCLYCRNADRQT